MQRQAEPMIIYIELDPWDQTAMKFESKHKNIQDTAFEYVACKMGSFYPECNVLLHCGQVMPYDDTNQGQPWI